MMDESYKQREKLAIAFAEFLASWNQCENLFRKVLQAYSGQSPATYILTAELNSRGIIAALTSFANDLSDEYLRSDVLYAIKFFEVVRVYRNYYAHGIYAFVSIEGESYGLITSMSAKARLSHTDEKITLNQIDWISQRTGELGGLAMRILIAINDNQSGTAHPQPQQWPEKPPLPRALVKSLQYPLGAERPPQSSPE